MWSRFKWSSLAAFVAVSLLTLLCGWWGSEGRGFRPVQNVREGWGGVTSVEFFSTTKPWTRERFGDLQVTADEIEQVRRKSKLVCNKTGWKYGAIVANAQEKGLRPSTHRDLLAFAHSGQPFSLERFVIASETWIEPGTLTAYQPMYKDDMVGREHPTKVRQMGVVGMIQPELQVNEGVCFLYLRPEKPAETATPEEPEEQEK